MDDEDLRGLFHRAFDGVAAPVGQGLATDDGRRPRLNRFGLVVAALLLVAVMAAGPVAARLLLHSSRPAAGGIATSPRMSDAPPSASPTSLPVEAAPPRSLIHLEAIAYRDTNQRIQVLISFDTPTDHLTKVVLSWSGSAVSDWSTRPELGTQTMLGAGADGHSAAWTFQGVGWTRLTLVPVGTPSADDLAVTARVETNPPMRLVAAIDAVPLQELGFMTIDGPRAVASGTTATYLLTWTTSEARVEWGGTNGTGAQLVSYRFISGSGAVVNTTPKGEWFIFKDRTGALELTYRFTSDGSPGTVSLDAFLGGTAVCCGSNRLAIHVNP